MLTKEQIAQMDSVVGSPSTLDTDTISKMDAVTGLSPTNLGRSPDLLDQILPTGIASMGRGPATFKKGDLNLLGNIANRPAAANRSFLMGKGYEKGASNPNAVPRFQDVILDKYYNKVGVNPLTVAGGFGVSGAGLLADIVTDPFALLTLIAGKTPMKGGSTLEEVIAKSTAGQAVGRFVNLPIEETGPVRYTSDAIQGLANQIKKLPEVVTKITDYPANKVNAIRRGFWDEYAPKEYKAYGDAIENLPKEQTGLIKGDSFIQNLESKMVGRGLITPDGTMQTTGITPADTRLIKAYQSVGKKWADSPTGELDIRDIVDGYKSIKGKYSAKTTSSQRSNIMAANDFFDSAADQINTNAFTLAKLRYKNFKDTQQAISKAIDLYASPIETAKGERWLMKGPIGETVQARKTAQLITDKTGQTLKGAKLRTGLKRMNPLMLLKR